MVIMVLLNEAFTCATPDAIFLRSRRRTRPAGVASLPIHDPFKSPLIEADRSNSAWALGRGLLLAGNGLRRTLAGAGIGVGALAVHRQALAVAQAPVAAEIHQPLYVHGDFAPKVALDHVVAVDHLADLQHLLVGQLRHPALRRGVDLLHDLTGVLLANAVDVLQRDDDALVGRNVYACNSRHEFTPVPPGCGPRRSRLFRRAIQAIMRRPPRHTGAGIVRTESD